MLSTLRFSFLIMAVAPLAYYLLSLYCVLDYFCGIRKLPAVDRSFTPPVSIIKPVRNVDREAYENFASFCRLDYPEYEIVFAVADREDPVIPVIHRLQRDFPKCAIRLVTAAAHLGANNKVNNLCQSVQAAKYELVVMSDSDVRVDPDYLRNVVDPFSDPQMGVVTALYRGIPGRSLASALEDLGMYTDSAPAALVARKLEGNMRFAFGWTMATTKRVLSEIGGFESMVNHHSDDFELGNRISQLGYRVELMRKPVVMVLPEESFGEFLNHELRWSIGLKNVRPLGYVGMLFTHGLPWTLVAGAVAISAGWSRLAVAYVLAYLVLRFGVVWITAAWGLGDGRVARKLLLVPVHDAISFVVWVGGFFFNKIVWRGSVYRVRKGLLIPVVSREGAH
ncbi:MAG: bacteriohopanetetrol glucosamine biosynthesis glycosyltransferase HpnI [Candidatus Acidiferrales bacterium]